MKRIQVPLGPLQTNAYILSNDENECVLFDPGSEGEKLNELITKHQLKPLAIFLTHAHFDHIGAVENVRSRFNIPVYIHEKEKDWLIDPALNGSQFFGMDEMIVAKEADHLLNGEGSIKVGPFSFKYFETPGHSPGSVSFYFEDLGVVFSGDVLFQGSVGRTDLPGGSYEVLMKSIHDKILTLPETTIISPGHGPETIIQNEMDSNPFLNGF